MGASGSTPIDGPSTSGRGSAFGSTLSKGGDGLHTAASWSSLTDQNSRPSESLSTFNLHTFQPKEKKKRNLAAHSLVTLKKRLVRRRRSSKHLDHEKVIRDFISGWSMKDLMQLVEDYEVMALLKELSLQAEVARPVAPNVQHDLCELYDYKYCADTILIFKGVHFPVHKAIVCVRCPLFRELLGKVNTFGAHVPVVLDIPGLRVELFNDLLRYLYAGEFNGPYDPRGNSYDVLMRISEECGVPNALDYDLKHLLETGLYSDACIVFSPPSGTSCDFSSNSKKCSACSDQAEFSCHRAILAARSPFFRNFIQKQLKRSATNEAFIANNNANQRIKIVLDESIIPRRFARILLHAMYRDAADLLQMLNLCVCKCQIQEQGFGSTSTFSATTASTSGSTCSVNSSASTITGSPPMSVILKEVMDLYEIARFLELDSLVQSCEDLLIDSLNIENLVPILKWSEQPHGSPWVKRQALCFLREEFSSIASSPVLVQLEKNHLIEALKSDFLQASELEVLNAVIKWGENQLIRRMEEREPNLVSQTAHSLRRSMKKKDLNDAELRDLISDLISHVRIGHILPMDNDTLASAAKRGLISTLPPFMLGEDNGQSQIKGISCWIKGTGTGLFTRPRFFTPYVEEAKAILEEKLNKTGESAPNRLTIRQISNIPDALYMVDKPGAHMTDAFTASGEHFHTCAAASVASTSAYEDVNEAGEIAKQPIQSQMPQIERRVLLLMRQRERELKTLALSHRALALVSNRCDVFKLIQLRVVREFGLPDAASDYLHNMSFLFPIESSEDSSYGALSSVHRSAHSHGTSGSGNALGSDKDPYSYALDAKLETQSNATRTSSGVAGDPYFSQFDLESHFSMESSSRQPVPDPMPDIALGDLRIARGGEAPPARPPRHPFM